MKTLQRIAPILLVLSAASPVFGATVPATDDTFIYNQKITINQGKIATAPVDAKHQALIKFDLSSIPAVAAADIRYARLRIYLPRVIKTGAGIDLKLVTAPWDEEVPAAGPAFNPVAFGNFPAASLITRRFVSIDITSVVQAWITTPATNLGIALVANGETRVVVSTKEGTGSGYPAELEVELADAPIAPGSIDSSLLAPNLTLGGTTSGTFSGDGTSLINISVASLVGQIGTTQIADGSVTALKLGADVGLWSVAGSNVYRAGGNVGIGINAPANRLHVVESAAADTNTLALLSNAGIGGGLSIQQTNPGNGARGIDVNQVGVGPGVFASSNGGNAIWGVTSTISGAGVIGDNNRFGEAVVGRIPKEGPGQPVRDGSGVGAVVGRNDMWNGYGIRGFVTHPSGGIGALGQVGISGGTGTAGRFENVNAANGGDALQAASNGPGWTANFTNANNSSASKGLRIATTAGQGGNALLVANGTVAASYQHPYASNTVVDDSTLVVTTAGNVTIPTGPPLVDGAEIHVVNNAGAVITITNTTAGAFNVNPGRAVKLLFVSTVSGANWIPVQP